MANYDHAMHFIVSNAGIIYNAFQSKNAEGVSADRVKKRNKDMCTKYQVVGLRQDLLKQKENHAFFSLFWIFLPRRFDVELWV